MKRRITDESGQVLALALAFIVFVGIVGVGLLSYATNSLKATVALRPVRSVDYAADGAVDGAINKLRASPLATTCNGADGFYRASPKLDDQEIVLSCSKVIVTSVPVVVRATFTAKCPAVVSAGCPVASAAVLSAQVLFEEKPGVMQTTVESWSSK